MSHLHDVGVAAKALWPVFATLGLIGLGLVIDWLGER